MRLRRAGRVEGMIWRKRIFLDFGAVQEDGFPFRHTRIIVFRPIPFKIKRQIKREVGCILARKQFCIRNNQSPVTGNFRPDVFQTEKVGSEEEMTWQWTRGGRNARAGMNICRPVMQNGIKSPGSRRLLDILFPGFCRFSNAMEKRKKSIESNRI